MTGSLTLNYREFPMVEVEVPCSIEVNPNVVVTGAYIKPTSGAGTSECKVHHSGHMTS